MHPAYVLRGGAKSCPIWFVATDTYAQVSGEIGTTARRFAESAKFGPRPGQFLLLPGADGALSGVLFVLEAAGRPEMGRVLPCRVAGLVPAGAYRFPTAAQLP